MKEINLSNDYDKYLEYLSSTTWAKLRDQALKRDGYHCSICNSPYNLEVHHLKYPDVLGTEPISDLMTLCRDCHKKLEDYKKSHKANRKMVTWKPPGLPKERTWKLWIKCNEEDSYKLEDYIFRLLPGIQSETSSSKIIFYDDIEHKTRIMGGKFSHSEIESTYKDLQTISAVKDMKIIKEKGE